MPIDHLNRETLEAFARRELPAEAMGEVDRHLAGCDTCRAIAPGSTGGQGLLAAVQFERARHLSFEELESLVDAGQNDIDALAQKHVAGCESCQRELADLRSFENLLERETGSPSVVTPPAGAASARLERGSWFANPFAWAATAAALVALVVVWPTLRQQADQATIAPSGFVVRLGGTTSPSGQGSNALRPGVSAPLPATVIQALGGARQRAADTGEAQTIDIRITGREFEALTDELRAIGAVESEPDVDVEPDLEILLSVTLLPKE